MDTPTSCRGPAAARTTAQGVAALSVLRVIRLARLARVLKVSRSMTGFLVLLRTIGKSLVPLGMLMVFVLSMSIFFTIVIGEAERGEYYADWEWKDVGYFRANGDRARFLDFGTAWWWCLQTLTSVGYGDLFPLTPAGYVIGSLAAVVGTIVLALPITIIGATFDEEYEKARKKRHFEALARLPLQRSVADGHARRRAAAPPPAEELSLFPLPPQPAGRGVGRNGADAGQVAAPAPAEDRRRPPA